MLHQLGNFPKHLSFIWGLSNPGCFLEWLHYLRTLLSSSQQQREGEGKLKNHTQTLKCFGSEMKHVALLTVQRSTSIKLMAKRPGNVEKHIYIRSVINGSDKRILYMFSNTTITTTTATNTTTNNNTMYLS